MDLRPSPKPRRRQPRRQVSRGRWRATEPIPSASRRLNVRVRADVRSLARVCAVQRADGRRTDVRADDPTLIHLEGRWQPRTRAAPNRLSTRSPKPQQPYASVGPRSMNFSTQARSNPSTSAGAARSPPTHSARTSTDSEGRRKDSEHRQPNGRPTIFKGADGTSTATSRWGSSLTDHRTGGTVEGVPRPRFSGRSMIWRRSGTPAAFRGRARRRPSSSGSLRTSPRSLCGTSRRARTTTTGRRRRRGSSPVSGSIVSTSSSRSTLTRCTRGCTRPVRRKARSSRFIGSFPEH